MSLACRGVGVIHNLNTED